MPLDQINRQWISYEDTGGRLPVVLAHGLLMDRRMFAPQVEAFAGTHRMITWDARCHGETESTDESFTYWDLADDLRGLLDSLEINRAVIGGTGQGGFVALRFALKYPERVSALVLMATSAGAEVPQKAANYAAVLDEWDRRGLNDELAESIAATIIGAEWPGRVEWISKWRQMPKSLLRRALETLIAREDIDHRVSEIQAPTLMIHGTADAAIEMDLAQRLCAQLPNCRPLILVEGAGHASNLTHAQSVNFALGQFLAELDLETRPVNERRTGARRIHPERRLRERREPNRASADRRTRSSSDRRLVERRTRERHESSPSGGRT